jgi:hypothetical protein
LFHADTATRLTEFAEKWKSGTLAIEEKKTEPMEDEATTDETAKDESIKDEAAEDDSSSSDEDQDESDEDGDTPMPDIQTFTQPGLQPVPDPAVLRIGVPQKA